MKSVKFIATSIDIIDTKDIPIAVLKANLNNICFVTNESTKGYVCGMYKPPSNLTTEDQYTAMNAAYATAMTINATVQNLFSDALQQLNDGKSTSEVAKGLACINGTFDYNK